MFALGCLLFVAFAVAVYIAVIYARKWKKRLFASNKRQTYAAPEAKPDDTELYEITDRTQAAENIQDIPHAYQNLTAIAASADVDVDENDSGYICTVPQYCANDSGQTNEAPQCRANDSDHMCEAVQCCANDSGPTYEAAIVTIATVRTAARV